MDYADRLRTLPRADLEELLVRRPETSALRSRRRVDYRDLAAVLAQPLAVHAAIASLDRFHRQVLELACVAGGRLDPEFGELQGLTSSLLPSAATELARWGLGFLDGRDLCLPECVLAAIDDPGHMGPPATSLLALASMEDLRTIAGTFELDLRSASTKTGIVALIAERMRDYAAVRETVAEAPPRAAEVLEALRTAGGASSWADVARAVPAVHGERGLWYAPLRPAADGIAWLRARALVAWVEWERRLVIPAEVELALRGRVFTDWEPRPPALELAPMEPDRHPVELVVEVDGLLDLWRGQPVALLQSGELGVRECRRAAAALRVPEESARFLASLAVSAGFVAVEEPPPVRRTRTRGRPPRRPAEPQAGRLAVVDEAVERWRGLDVVERWTALIGPWRRLLSQPGELLQLVLDELGRLPEGQGAVASSLARRLAWRHPSSFAGVEATYPVLGSALATLHRLGVGSGPTGPILGVTVTGRAALRGAGAAELAPLFPPVESGCTVQADLQIIISGPPDPALARELARLADMETASPARVYRLSEASLRRALDSGLGAAEIAALLDTRCPTGVPQNVAALIEDVGRRHGRLRVGRAALYLQADDPALLAEVAVNRRLRGLRVTLLAPTVAVVDGADEAQALETLRRAGYMPRVDGGLSSAEPPKKAAPPTRRPAPAAAPPPAPDSNGSDRRRLAERLLAAAPVTTPELDDDALLSGDRVSGRDGVERLLRLAVRTGRAVEIEYHNTQSGSVSRRVIEPRLAGDDTVVGWCRLRQDDRAFAFDGVRWARATGEAIAQTTP